jgi:hypothetical protein
MKTFKTYLLEAKETGEKLLHLQHMEDLHIDHGKSGFDHAVKALHQTKEHVESGKADSSLTTKIDGSPSVVMGHHPKTGKYFVASKSAFNKDPKINYTHEDIERNHGHAPGLVEKLKAALDHGHKIVPKSGVFQGDILHAGAHDMKHTKSGVSIKPNTITYKAKGEEADKLKKSKFGVALHTEYHGSDLEDMKAAPISDHSKFKSHEDVYAPSVAYKGSGKKLSGPAEKKFHAHVAAATEAHGAIDHSHIEQHREHLNTYINQTVRTGETPSHAGYLKHLEDKKNKAVSSVKTEKAKSAKSILHQSRVDLAAGAHKGSIEAALKAHHHLQSAKNILVKHMDDSHTGLESSINGKKTGPEGYVSNVNGKSAKLVNRAQFSRANLLR